MSLGYIWRRLAKTSRFLLSYFFFLCSIFFFQWMMHINYSDEASSEHLRGLAGSALRMTGSDACSQLGHARTHKKKQKKPLFSQLSLLAALQRKLTHLSVCVYDDWRARLLLAMRFFWSRSCNVWTSRRRVMNYVHVHRGRCFSESLEQIFYR